MPEATLSERIAIGPILLMSELTLKAKSGLAGPPMTHDEAWADVARAMRGCLA